MPAGYSGTPLAKKLGIKEGMTLLLCNQPRDYFMLFDTLPEDLTLLESPAPETSDFIHIFSTSEQEMTRIASTYKEALKKNGMLWVSWPKGKSNIETDLKRDWIRAHFLNLGLVDVKVAAIDDDWSGLKFMYRIKDR